MKSIKLLFAVVFLLAFTESALAADCLKFCPQHKCLSGLLGSECSSISIECKKCMTDILKGDKVP